MNIYYLKSGLRRSVLLAVVFCLAGGLSVAGQTLKVMSYNIHHGSDIHETLQLKQIAALVRKTGADIVGLVEVDSMCHRSGETDQPALLARMTGLHPAFVRHFPFEGGAYGVALLSRYPISDVVNERVPVMTDENGDSTRALLLATLNLPEGKQMKVAVVHMDYRSGRSRIRQANTILKLLEPVSAPVMILGDLNAMPDAPAIKLLKSRFMDVNNPDDKTFPSENATKKIDYIMVDRAHYGETLKDTVYAVSYSDHLPIAAEIKIAND